MSAGRLRKERKVTGEAACLARSCLEQPGCQPGESVAQGGCSRSLKGGRWSLWATPKHVVCRDGRCYNAS